MASRNCTLPSPRVIRPLRSRTVTPSTSREAIVSATDIPPCWYYVYHALAVRAGRKPRRVPLGCGDAPGQVYAESRKSPGTPQSSYSIVTTAIQQEIE